VPSPGVGKESPSLLKKRSKTLFEKKEQKTLIHLQGRSQPIWVGRANE
jgi:hypothetical protein